MVYVVDTFYGCSTKLLPLFESNIIVIDKDISTSDAAGNVVCFRHTDISKNTVSSIDL